MPITKRIVTCLSLLVIAGIIMFIVFNSKPLQKNANMTEIEKVKEFEFVTDLEKLDETMQIMHTFIKDRLLVSDVFLEFHLEENDEPITDAALRVKSLEVLYSAIEKQDMNLFAMAFTGEAMQEVWGSEIVLEKRIEKIALSLKNIGRDDLFKTIRYHFEKDQYDFVSEKGVLYLEYLDGVEIPIEFELTRIGEDEERYYQFTNSILEIEQQILNYN